MPFYAQTCVQIQGLEAGPSAPFDANKSRSHCFLHQCTYTRALFSGHTPCHHHSMSSQVTRGPDNRGEPLGSHIRAAISSPILSFSLLSFTCCSQLAVVNSFMLCSDKIETRQPVSKAEKHLKGEMAPHLKKSISIQPHQCASLLPWWSVKHGLFRGRGLIMTAV